MFLPPDLRKVTAAHLERLDRATERQLKREIVRLCVMEPAFGRALKQALAVEDEIERRKAPE